MTNRKKQRKIIKTHTTKETKTVIDVVQEKLNILNSSNIGSLVSTKENKSISIL